MGKLAEPWLGVIAGVPLQVRVLGADGYYHCYCYYCYYHYYDDDDDDDDDDYYYHCYYYYYYYN